jgi:uncharacterized membrane protein YgaE (UPF0421/DUF939 family)
MKEVKPMFDIRKIFGPRIIKTGISTFLTALICILLNLPPIFAVITAIVTIEPTAYASIKKAYVRFPASIIGAFIAVASLYLIGENAFTYAISATLTILVTYRLKLYDGMLVAAITSVAMVPSVDDAYVYNFVSRLATTTIGLGTSTFINYLVMPPKYTPQIDEIITQAKEDTETILEKRLREIGEEKYNSPKTEKRYSAIQKQLSESERFIQYQQQEYKYHKSKRTELRQLNSLEQALQYEKIFLTRIGNLIYLPDTDSINLLEDESKAILDLSEELSKNTPKVEEILAVLRDRVDNAEHYPDDFKVHLLHEVIIIVEMHYQKR